MGHSFSTPVCALHECVCGISVVRWSVPSRNACRECCSARGSFWRASGATPSPGLCLKGGGVPPPPNAPPSTLPEGTSATPIPPPPPAFPTARDSPTDFTARPNRFVTALSLPPERPPLQANPCPSPPCPTHGPVQGTGGVGAVLLWDPIVFGTSSAATA